MKNFLFIITFIVSFNFTAQAQDGITKINDKLEEVKAKLEAKGLEVSFDKPDKKTVVHPFIMKWTNESMPDFKLNDINGNSIDSKTFTGKFVHINFWSTTCKPCIEEFPELDEIKQKYGDDEVVYLAIAPESSKLVRKVLKKRPVNYIVIADASDLFGKLGINGYPKNMFINKDGTIIKITDGTHYSMEVVNEKLKLVPNNFQIYDRIMSELIK